MIDSLNKGLLKAKEKYKTDPRTSYKYIEGGKWNQQMLWNQFLDNNKVEIGWFTLFLKQKLTNESNFTTSCNIQFAGRGENRKIYVYIFVHK